MSRFIGSDPIGIHGIILNLIDPGNIQGTGHDGMVHAVTGTHIGDNLVLNGQYGSVIFNSGLNSVDLISPMPPVS